VRRWKRKSTNPAADRLNLTHNSEDDYTVAQRKIYRNVENWQERRSKSRKGIIVSRNRQEQLNWFKFQSKLNENFFDHWFFDD
jgi:hypothetical protein